MKGWVLEVSLKTGSELCLFPLTETQAKDYANMWRKEGHEAMARAVDFIP